MLASFITGVLLLLLGVIGFYMIYKPINEEKQHFSFSLRGLLLFLSQIFILLGCMAILGYCFAIDGSFITQELTDDMTVWNGIALGVSSLAISGWIELFLKRIKQYHRTVLIK